MEQHLRHLLAELDAAIARSSDAERAELSRLHSGVERRLAESAPEEHHGLVDSLQRAETGLEAAHPSLAQSIRQALQALSSAGM